MSRRIPLLGLILALASCTQVPANDAVVLNEFSVALPVITRGTNELAVRNDGAFPHTLVISDELGRVLVATEPIAPGEGTSVPVDLDRGRYQFSCRIVVETPDGGISDHFDRGMVADLDL